MIKTLTLKEYINHIDDLISDWHMTLIPQELYEYLGWTKEEYKEYIEKGYEYIQVLYNKYCNYM